MFSRGPPPPGQRAWRGQVFAAVRWRPPTHPIRRSPVGLAGSVRPTAAATAFGRAARRAERRCPMEPHGQVGALLIHMAWLVHMVVATLTSIGR